MRRLLKITGGLMGVLLLMLTSVKAAGQAISTDAPIEIMLVQRQDMNFTEEAVLELIALDWHYQRRITPVYEQIQVYGRYGDWYFYQAAWGWDSVIGKFDHYGLFRLSLKTGEIERLLHHTQEFTAHIAENGNRALVWLRNGAMAELVRIEDGQQENLTAHYAAQFTTIPNPLSIIAPDASAIVFVATTQPNNQSDVYMLQADGTGLVNLTATLDGPAIPRHWPDGGEWVVISDQHEQLWRVHPDGTELAPLTDHHAGGAEMVRDWHEAADLLLVQYFSTVVTETQLGAVRLGEDEPRWLKNLPTGLQMTVASPAAQSVYVIEPYEISRVDENGDLLRFVGVTFTGRYANVLVGDGQLVALLKGLSPQSVNGFSHIPGEGEGLLGLQTINTLLLQAWTPDQKRFIFGQSVRGGSQLHWLDPTSGETAPLTEAGMDNRFLLWLPPIERAWSSVLLSAAGIGFILLVFAPVGLKKARKVGS